MMIDTAWRDPALVQAAEPLSELCLTAAVFCVSLAMTQNHEQLTLALALNALGTGFPGVMRWKNDDPLHAAYTSIVDGTAPPALLSAADAYVINRMTSDENREPEHDQPYQTLRTVAALCR